MSFFKSVFSDDPNPSGSQESNNAPHSESPNAPVSPSAAWNFGSLIKTLSEKSETVIEVYRRDLHEFGTGLKKEIEVAHGSLETVGHVIDRFGNTVIKGTTQIISQGKDAILDSDSDSDSDNSNNHKNKKQSSFNSKLYNRFDSQVRAIQGDPKTFTAEPLDLERYNKWKLDFSLEGKNEEMEGFLKENEAMDSVYKMVVPNVVDSETFWLRYYYKLYKVKKAEDVRAGLVRRMARVDEEELSWDVEDDNYDDNEDDDDDDDEKNGREGGNFDGNGVVGIKRLDDSSEEETKVEKRNSLSENKMKEESKVDDNLEVVQEKGNGRQVDDGKDSVVDSDKRMTVESNVGDEKSLPVVSRDKEHEEVEEKDLEWDEIEELGRFDEKKAMGNGSPSKIDIRKRLSSAAEEEDLSWDIEDDDDELTKA